MNTPPFCKNCGHKILIHVSKEDKKTVLHYNRKFFGLAAINHEHCNMCEVTHPNDFSKQCNKPQE